MSDNAGVGDVAFHMHGQMVEVLGGCWCAHAHTTEIKTLGIGICEASAKAEFVFMRENFKHGRTNQAFSMAPSSNLLMLIYIFL